MQSLVYPEIMPFKSISLFITLLCFMFNNPCYSDSDTLHQGQQLKEWDELISSNRIFSLKFFSFGSMVSPYLGVFYIQKKDMAVWVANRNNPIPDLDGKLIIDSNGKLSILSGEGTVIDLFSPSELVERNASVTLKDSGNLVLQELHPNGSVKQDLWQSFDHPTDTLLPGMKLGVNLKTGHKLSLTSWRDDELPADGLAKLDLNGTGQMNILRQENIVHWTSGPWLNGDFKNTDLQSSGPDVRLFYVSNETEHSFMFLTRTYDSYPALRMHQDGWLLGSHLKLNIRCHSTGDPPGCAEEDFEMVECRKEYELWSQRVNNADDESYNLSDCFKVCGSDCHCATYSRGSCKTVGKTIFRRETHTSFNPFYTFG